jgi:hypothetical protein
MKTQTWSKEEIGRMFRLLNAGYPAAAIASVLGRSEGSVRYKIYNLGYSSRQIFEPEYIGPSVDQAAPDEVPIEESKLRSKAEDDLKALEIRREVRKLTNEYKEDALEERIIQEFRDRLINFPTRIEIPPMVGRKTPPGDDSLVIILSDSHVGQVVDPSETGQSSGYNPYHFLARLHHLETEIARIAEGHPAKRVVVLFCGDMVHGQLGHSIEDDLTLPIATQVDLAMHAFFHFLGRISALSPVVEVHGVGGNHGRWPGTRKMPTDRRWSQLDTLLYRSLQALCEVTMPNVSFDDRVSARRLIDVEDFRILLLHGDQLRGGANAANGITKEMHHWLMRCAQTGSRPPDLLVCGDKHISATLPVGLGRALINGSFVGEDVFAQNFPPSPPSQTVFYVRPKVGLTETHVIRLDQAERTEELPYKLKPELQQLVMGFATVTNKYT